MDQNLLPKHYSQPSCSHYNTIYDFQLQKTKVLRTQLQWRGALTQPFRSDLQPQLQNIMELRTTAAQIAAPKLDLDAKAENDDFEALFKGILKGKSSTSTSTSMSTSSSTTTTPKHQNTNTKTPTPTPKHQHQNTNTKTPTPKHQHQNTTTTTTNNNNNKEKIT